MALGRPLDLDVPSESQPPQSPTAMRPTSPVSDEETRKAEEQSANDHDELWRKLVSLQNRSRLQEESRLAGKPGTQVRVIDDPISKSPRTTQQQHAPAQGRRSTPPGEEKRGFKLGTHRNGSVEFPDSRDSSDETHQVDARSIAFATPAIEDEQFAGLSAGRRKSLLKRTFSSRKPGSMQSHHNPIVSLESIRDSTHSHKVREHPEVQPRRGSMKPSGQRGALSAGARSKVRGRASMHAGMLPSRAKIQDSDAVWVSESGRRPSIASVAAKNKVRDRMSVHAASATPVQEQNADARGNQVDGSTMKAGRTAIPPSPPPRRPVPVAPARRTFSSRKIDGSPIARAPGPAGSLKQSLKNPHFKRNRPSIVSPDGSFGGMNRKEARSILSNWRKLRNAPSQNEGTNEADQSKSSHENEEEEEDVKSPSNSPRNVNVRELPQSLGLSPRSSAVRGMPPMLPSLRRMSMRLATQTKSSLKRSTPSVIPDSDSDEDVEVVHDVEGLETRVRSKEVPSRRQTLDQAPKSLPSPAAPKKPGLSAMMFPSLRRMSMMARPVHHRLDNHSDDAVIHSTDTPANKKAESTSPTSGPRLLVKLSSFRRLARLSLPPGSILASPPNGE